MDGRTDTTSANNDHLFGRTAQESMMYWQLDEKLNSLSKVNDQQFGCVL